MSAAVNYAEEHIIDTMDWKEHIRCRPGMYIGKLGDGTSADDGIYILLKELLNGIIDPSRADAGQNIEITLAGRQLTVRDCGYGVPLDKLADMAFRNSKPWDQGGRTGIRGINALSSRFMLCSVSDGESRTLTFEAGNEVADVRQSNVNDQNGTCVSFTADESVFGTYAYRPEHVESIACNYTCLKAGLTIQVNDPSLLSKNGLLDRSQANETERQAIPGIQKKES